MPKNNVNPNHYKTRGRERQGDDIVQEVHKQKYVQWRSGVDETSGLPRAPQENAAPNDADSTPGGETGQVNESANSSKNT